MVRCATGPLEEQEALALSQRSVLRAGDCGSASQDGSLQTGFRERVIVILPVPLFRVCKVLSYLLFPFSS